MEKAILIGFRKFSFEDPQKHLIEGYTLFLLEPIKGNENKGFMPLQFYDRYNNRTKYPSISLENFEKFGIGNLKLNSQVNILFDRNNKLIEITQ